ncbi:MAG: hypothetical protein OHK0023_16190 [Anaerolineae bacterium]
MTQPSPDRRKLEPDTEYADYYDGDGGEYIYYYGLHGSRTVSGAGLPAAREELKQAWEQVGFTHHIREGLIWHYRRKRPKLAHQQAEQSGGE